MNKTLIVAEAFDQLLDADATYSLTTDVLVRDQPRLRFREGIRQQLVEAALLGRR